MNFNELRAKFDGMEKKTWRTVGGKTPVQLAGFWVRPDGTAFISLIHGAVDKVVDAETLALCYTGASSEPFIEAYNPYSDWPMDAPAWFWREGLKSDKVKGHFAGVTSAEKPMAWEDMKTSWTADGMLYARVIWDHAELAEKEEEENENEC